MDHQEKNQVLTLDSGWPVYLKEPIENVVYNVNTVYTFVYHMEDIG